MESRQPLIYLLERVLRVEHGVDDQLGAVALDDGAGVLLADHVDEVGPGLEGGDGGEVGRARVHDAAAKDADPTALTFVKVMGQLRDDCLDLEQKGIKIQMSSRIG